MSRVAKAPIDIPDGVEITRDGNTVQVRGKSDALSFELPAGTDLEITDGEARALATGRTRDLAMAGTVRAIVANMVVGVTEGFQRRLDLVGVGYRAQMQGSKLRLSLGYSHPVEYDAPAGVSVETPTQTQILVKGANKQMVGQAAAKIRSFRTPEPYKGKGVRFAGERIIQKEAKKK